MKADREQFSPFVIEKLEIHLQRIRTRTLGNCAQSFRIDFAALGRKHQLRARLLRRNQVAGEISTVHRRYVGRLQHLQVSQIVPVVEMSPETPHALQRPEHLLHPVDRGFECYEREIVGGNDRHQLEPDVRRRCTGRYDWLRLLLIIVGGQPLRGFAHEILEVLPVESRISQRRLSLRFSQPQFGCSGRSAQRMRDRRRSQP